MGKEAAKTPGKTVEEEKAKPSRPKKWMVKSPKRDPGTVRKRESSSNKEKSGREEAEADRRENGSRG